MGPPSTAATSIWPCRWHSKHKQRSRMIRGILAPLAGSISKKGLQDRPGHLKECADKEPGSKPPGSRFSTGRTGAALRLLAWGKLDRLNCRLALPAKNGYSRQSTLAYTRETYGRLHPSFPPSRNRRDPAERSRRSDSGAQGCISK